MTNLASGELALPTLGYGAANLGNMYRELSDEQAGAVLEAAWDAGIRYFDTAPHYGLGLSERRLGDFLRTKPRHEYVLSTKVGRLLRPNPEGAGGLDLDNSFVVPSDVKRVWDFSADGVRMSIEESIERMGIDRFDVLYLHDPERADVALPLSERIGSALSALVSLRDEGVTDAIGVGSMVSEALLQSAEFAAERSSGRSHIDLLMIAGRYTLAEQPALAEVVPACATNGIGIVNASVFNSGLLASDAPSASSRYEYGEVPAAVLDRVTAIADVARHHGVSLPTAALQYSLRDASVRSIVVGSSRPEQVRENAERMRERVPSAFWDELVERRLIPS
ncbi:aldo/keto reductase [Lysinibacter cavernae]|uniref:D-threo-aldose 1-dehydrogenase n=1 Tax=Lysinibacter cavernae TaxID=1640652 RepID=A0A7X5TUF9_9MICO|nr:aldo/keto reductase [Lysinibacter cavernae]NIH54519.1 D-threo-aldose 1-dehydrogenase [Lysinibacter cavernae]